MKFAFFVESCIFDIHTYMYLLFQAYNGHGEALNVLLGCIMNLDIRDYHGNQL